MLFTLYALMLGSTPAEKSSLHIAGLISDLALHIFTSISTIWSWPRYNIQPVQQHHVVPSLWYSLRLEMLSKGYICPHRLMASQHAPLSIQTIDRHMYTKSVLSLHPAMHNVQPSSVIHTLRTVHDLHAKACIASAEGL